MSCPEVTIQTIVGTECIGDSLPKIMGNFNGLRDAACDLFTRVNGLSSNSSLYALKTTVTGLSSYADSRFALKTTVTALSTYVDANFIPNPQQRNDKDILTFNAASDTWESTPPAGGGHLIAWAYFDGTKDTAGATSTDNTNRLILASNGIGSVYRAATGQFQINFDPILLSPKYIILGNGSKPSYPLVVSPNLTNANVVVPPTNTSCTVLFNDVGAHDRDPLYGYIAIFGTNLGDYTNLLILFLKHGEDGKDERTIINAKNWTGGVVPNRIHVSITTQQSKLNVNGTVIQNSGNNNIVTDTFWITIDPSNGGSFYVKCYDNNYGAGSSAFTFLGWD